MNLGRFKFECNTYASEAIVKPNGNATLGHKFYMQPIKPDFDWDVQHMSPYTLYPWKQSWYKDSGTALHRR